MFNELGDHIDDIENDLDDVRLQNDYSIKGIMQYCTGWILLAAASIVFSLGLESKPKSV
jgi:hypothetical protein